MKIINQAIETARRLVTRPQGELTRWQRTARWWIDLTRHCARELHHDRAGQMAAALTYHTLFSLLPTLVLMLVVLQAFLGDDKREQWKQTVIEFVTRPLQADTAGATVTAPPGPEGVEPRPDTDRPAVADTAERQMEFAQARQAMGQQIRATLDELEQVNFGSIGVVGMLIFLWGATALLATIERSFNLIYSAGRSRPWYLRLPIYYFVITAGPFVVITGQLAQRVLISTLESGAWTNWLAGPLIVLLPLLTTWVVLLALYVLLPYTKVHLRPAAVGSFAAAVLWVLAIEGLTLYISRFAAGGAYGKIYGALGLLPLFLLWLWVTWLIVLFGLEVTYTLQAMKGRKFKHEERERQRLFIDAATLIPLAAHIASAFGEGRTCDITDLTRQLALPDHATRRLIDLLVDQRIVHRVEANGEPAYSLARPPEQVSVDQLLEAGAKLLPKPTDGSKQPVWQLVDQLRHGKAPDKPATLADLAGPFET